jgi:MtN3 and saliva related transmembrane protein
MELQSLGYLAAAFTTAAFAPQAFMTIRTRNTSGISLAMYAIFTLGVVLWFAYGIALESWPIIVANGATLPLAATVLALKLRHG